MSAEIDHAILMSYDAMRICMGQSPVNATVSEVIRWMQVISGEPDRIAELEKERERIMEVTIDKQSLGNLTFTYNPDDGRFYAFRGSNLAWSGQATYTVWRAVLMSEELTKLRPRIAELEAKVARLREDGKRLFYSYDPENGIEFHESAEEAKQRAQKALDDAEFHAADSDWHWVGNEHEISWGSVREQVEMHEREMTPEDKTTHPECTYMCAPKLEPIDAAMSAEGK